MRSVGFAVLRSVRLLCLTVPDPEMEMIFGDPMVVDDVSPPTMEHLNVLEAVMIPLYSSVTHVV